MEQQFIKGGYGGTEIHVGLEGHTIIDFDRRLMRKALVSGAAEVRREARRLVARKAISSPGDFPGAQTGALKRAIGVVSKGSRGGWIKVGVKKTAGMKAFYPAFLFYGSKGQGRIERLEPGQGVGKLNRRRRGERARLIEERKASTGYIVAPRANYMVAALDARREIIRERIRTALKNALVPR